MASSSHVVSRLFLWIGHRVGHANDLVRLTTIFRRMVSPTITTPIIMSFRPTLTLCMPPTTKMMEFLPLRILTNLSSRRRPPIVIVSILNLPLNSLVWWRWTTIVYLITHLPTSTKLPSMSKLATLKTPQS